MYIMKSLSPLSDGSGEGFAYYNENWYGQQELRDSHWGITVTCTTSAEWYYFGKHDLNVQVLPVLILKQHVSCQ